MLPHSSNNVESSPPGQLILATILGHLSLALRLQAVFAADINGSSSCICRPDLKKLSSLLQHGTPTKQMEYKLGSKPAHILFSSIHSSLLCLGTVLEYIRTWFDDGTIFAIKWRAQYLVLHVLVFIKHNGDLNLYDISMVLFTKSFYVKSLIL